MIEAEEETELSYQNNRYALVPVDHLNTLTATTKQQMVTQNQNRYEYIPFQPMNGPSLTQSPNRYESKQQNLNRYEYIQTTPQKPQPR